MQSSLNVFEKLRDSKHFSSFGSFKRVFYQISDKFYPKTKEFLELSNLHQSLI